MKRILLVDDEPDVRSFLEYVLRDAGYEVDLAEDGAVALSRLGERPPDLVILDLNMPRMDGWGVLDRIGEGQSPPPVILLTSQDDSISFVRAFQQGVAAFVRKPFRFIELLQLCDRVLGAPDAPIEAERRTEPRRPVSAAVRVLSDEEVLLALGELVDLSRHGARLRMSAACAVGSRLWLALYQPSGQVGPRVAGTVRWCADEPGGHTLGLSLNDLFGAAA